MKSIYIIIIDSNSNSFFSHFDRIRILYLLYDYKVITIIIGLVVRIQNDWKTGNGLLVKEGGFFFTKLNSTL